MRRLRHTNSQRQDQDVSVLRVLWQVLLSMLSHLAAVVHTRLCGLHVRLSADVRGEQEGEELLGEDLQRAAHHARESKSQLVSRRLECICQNEKATHQALQLSQLFELVSFQCRHKGFKAYLNDFFFLYHL